MMLTHATEAISLCRVLHLKSRFLVLLAVVLFVAPLSSAFARGAAKTSRHDTVIARSGDDGMPRVARNQIRPQPRRIHALDCADGTGVDCLLNPDPGGDNYKAGGCNCKRNCGSGPGCSLGTNNQCKAILGGSCENCTNTDCL